MLDHMVVLFSVFKKQFLKDLHTVFHSSYTNLPTNNVQGFSFSTFSPNLVLISDNSYSDKCKVIAHSGFDLHCPDNLWYWVPFHVPVGYLYVFFFGKVLYILDINPLSGIIVQLLSCVWLFASPWTAARQAPLFFLLGIFFVSISLHSVGFLFILLVISFAMQKIFSLM